MSGSLCFSGSASDVAGRKEIMSQILAYNEEDLDATRAVLDWE